MRFLRQWQPRRRREHEPRHARLRRAAVSSGVQRQEAGKQRSRRTGRAIVDVRTHRGRASRASHQLASASFSPTPRSSCCFLHVDLRGVRAAHQWSNRARRSLQVDSLCPAKANRITQGLGNRQRAPCRVGNFCRRVMRVARPAPANTPVYILIPNPVASYAYSSSDQLETWPLMYVSTCMTFVNQHLYMQTMKILFMSCSTLPLGHFYLRAAASKDGFGHWGLQWGYLRATWIRDILVFFLFYISYKSTKILLVEYIYTLCYGLYCRRDLHSKKI
jgi:hypothetical protein